MMSAAAHNRLRGAALYVTVRDLLARHYPQGLSNTQLRDLLLQAYPAEEPRVNLLARIKRTTRQLYRDGMADRTLGLNERKCPKYTYTYRHGTAGQTEGL